MALLPGYEYDVFISYRHNDNLDGWVSGFVEALEKELKATIKEPLSIYFDKNPHDGLLETHHVDKSLEGKLKCLIFIPIISQTYCDTKSFAWQHEFVAFNKLAKEDELGREIKLSNSNVASRILPVKIHDLDASDKAIFENELGGALRAIEFIYKEPGVNRPLKPTDTRADNQNKTDYRNQINKVANAVKEIVNALKNPQSPATTNHQQPSTKPSASKKRIWVALAAVILLATAYFFYQKRTTTAQQPTLDKSIAVLPFTDMSPNHEYEYLGDGISEEIINVLSNYDSLPVVSRTSSFQFKNQNQDVRLVAQQLGVTHVLEGSIRMFESRLRVNANLVDGVSGKQVWSESFTLEQQDLLKLQEEIAYSVALAVQVKSEKKRVEHSSRNPQAYEFYLKGLFFQNKGSPRDLQIAREYFEKSVKFDSLQPHVWSYLYSLANDDTESAYFAKMAYQSDSTSLDALVVRSVEFIANLRFEEGNRCFERLLSRRSRNPKILRNTAFIACLLGKHRLSVQLAQQAVSLDPAQTWSLFQLGRSYAAAGKFEDAIKAYEQSIQMSGNEGIATYELIAVLSISGRLETLKKMKLEKNEKEYAETLLTLKSGSRNEIDSLLNVLADEIRIKEEPYTWATIQAFLDNEKEALLFLERAIAIRDPRVFRVLETPFFYELRNNPSFWTLIDQLKIPVDQAKVRNP